MKTVKTEVIDFLNWLGASTDEGVLESGKFAIQLKLGLQSPRSKRIICHGFVGLGETKDKMYRDLSRSLKHTRGLFFKLKEPILPTDERFEYHKKGFNMPRLIHNNL